MKLPAISLWQPWASLIAIGAKTIETRSNKPPYGLIGKRIAIHAAKKWDRENRLTVRHEPFATDLQMAHLISQGMIYLPFGAIVATAKIAACYSVADNRLSEVLSPREFAYGNYRQGRFGWVLTDIQALESPLPWKGSQGWFPVEIPDHLLAASGSNG